MDIRAAAGILRKELKNDPGYRMSWQANIAMAFKSEFERGSELNNDPLNEHEKLCLHDIANAAADNFLNNLTRES